MHYISFYRHSIKAVVVGGGFERQRIFVRYMHSKGSVSSELGFVPDSLLITEDFYHTVFLHR